MRHVLLLGRDGLLVRHLGTDAIDVETVAAMVPTLASAAGSLGEATRLGDLATAVLELGEGVTIVVSLPDELLLALVLDPGVGFAPLLREARAERDRLAALL